MQDGSAGEATTSSTAAEDFDGSCRFRLRGVSYPLCGVVLELTAERQLLLQAVSVACKKYSDMRLFCSRASNEPHPPSDWRRWVPIPVDASWGASPQTAVLRLKLPVLIEGRRMLCIFSPEAHLNVSAVCGGPVLGDNGVLRIQARWSYRQGALFCEAEHSSLPRQGPVSWTRPEPTTHSSC